MKSAKVVITSLLVIHLIFSAAAAGQSSKSGQEREKVGVEFIDVTEQAGIRWGIRKLASGPLNLIETMGGGGGFLDYDGDGLLDIFLVCYSQEFQNDTAVKLRDALYRNNGDGTFTDVTERAGIANSMRGMGAAAGDYDNDGWTDLYVTGYGESKLYRNNGNGTFTEVTAKAGVDNKGKWGTSAAFFDYDNDRFPDLFVCNYLQFDPLGKNPCVLIDNKPYCSISQFKGSVSALYRNNGDGTFTDITQKAGVANSNGKGLGVVAGDFNNDGRIDIFQANDTAPNFLYRNNGDGTFTDIALESEVAFDPNGQTRGGMGADAADIDLNSYLDIFVANFTGETNAFFHNQGDWSFIETTNDIGLGRVSVPMSGFGVRFCDYDNDGMVDLFVINGHPFEPINKVWPSITFAEPPFLFRNTGKGFSEVAAEHGAALRKMYPGRGLATGDYDNDGDVDLLLMNVGEPPALLRNDGGNRKSWLGVRLIGTKSNRDAVGAKVTVTAGGVRRWKHVLGGTSYCSASDMRLLFGLAANSKVERIEVSWPSGRDEILHGVAINQYITIKEGAGILK